MNEPRRSPVTAPTGTGRAARIFTALGAVVVGVLSAGTCPTVQFVQHARIVFRALPGRRAA